MSKIGKLPVEIKPGVTVTINGNQVAVNGPKGNFTYALPLGITANVENNILTVSQVNPEDKTLKAMYGLTRASLNNMITGAATGFEKKLELQGVGYRAQVQGASLVLSLGFAHPVNIPAENGITFLVKDNVITVSGIDKAQVGNVAAEIRAIKPPEPYKGKGIRYAGEQIRRKAGKSAKAVGGK